MDQVIWMWKFNGVKLPPRKVVRRHTKSRVAESYAALGRLIGGRFYPGSHNTPQVLEAERNGLSVIDGVLGHILNAKLDHSIEVRALELIRRVAANLVVSEVENKCHNLHGSLAMMLDKIGSPAVVVTGSLHASAADGRGFVLAGYQEPRFPGHVPAHSWVVTPFAAVCDLALRYQINVGEDYEQLQSDIPFPILTRDRRFDEPNRSWWRLPGTTQLIPSKLYGNATKYHDVLGWSECTSGPVTIRYLPAAVGLPVETDMNRVNIRISGLCAGDFSNGTLAILTFRCPLPY